MNLSIARAGISLASLAALASLATLAHADDHKSALGTFLLQIGETNVGVVRAMELAERPGPSAPNLVLVSSEVTPALGAIVDGFAGSKPLRANARLSSGAVSKKADGARLVSVKLPPVGAGGSTDVELGFVAPSITTQPVLSLKQASARSASGSRIAGFRLAVEGLPSGSASKVAAIAIAQRADGVATTTTPEIAFEVSAGGAPPFTAWLKKPASRAMHVEYVGADGSTLLKVQLDRCTPTSVTPLGASAATRVTTVCGMVRPRS